MSEEQTDTGGADGCHGSAEDAAKRREIYLAILELVAALVQAHGLVLVAKRRQGTYRDDYGVLIDAGWKAEVEYFREHVVGKELEKFGEATLSWAMVHAYDDTPPSKRVTLGFSTAEGYLNDRIRSHIESQVAELDEATPKGIIDEGSCTPAHYEEACADLLRSSGWSVRQCGGTGDQGVDLVADRGGVRAVFQCKMYSGAVGNGAVQEVHTGRTFHDAQIAAVVSPSGFTPGARSAAEQARVLLLHHSQLATFDPAG